MRERASCSVVQAMLVPGVLTSGSAAQMSSAPHSMSTKLPFAQSAKAFPTQALSVHVLIAVRDSNCALSCCASLPFWSTKEEVEPGVLLVVVAVVVVAGAAPHAEAVLTVTGDVNAKVGPVVNGRLSPLGTIIVAVAVVVEVLLSPPELALL